MPEERPGPAIGVAPPAGRRPGRSFDRDWTAMGYGALGSLIIVIFVFWKAELIVRIFNSDPELVRITSTYVRIISAQFATLCGATIFAQALNTAGDTFSTLIASVVTLLGIELPLSYLLATMTGWGVYSRAVATVISTTVRFLLYISFFQWGKWREKRIRFETGERMRVAGRGQDVLG